MKVVLVGPAYPYRGGIANFNAGLYHAFHRRGHSVALISFLRQYPSLLFPGQTQFEQGAPILPIQARPLIDSINPISWFRAAAHIRAGRPDVLVFSYWMPFFAPSYSSIAAISKKGRKTKVLYVCHNIIPHEKGLGDWLLSKVGLGPVDYFVVMSQSVQHDLLRLKPDARFVRVEHPLYDLFGKPYDKALARRKLNLPENMPVLLFFGFIRRYKGLQLLIKAMPHILKKQKVKLLVAGEFYEASDEYLELISKLNLSEHILFHSNFIPNKDVSLYFSAADIVTLPYISATQSGVVPLAYHFDRPVVATPVGGLPEVIVSGRTGEVASDVTPEAFAYSVLKLLDNRNKIDFRRNIREYKRRFSWDFMVEQIEKMVGKL